MGNEFDKEIKKANDEKAADTQKELRYGWICPVCGRGLSPFMSYCNCQKPGFRTSWKGSNG